MRTVALIVPRGEAEPSSAKREDVVPEARLEVALELREVEVRPACRASSSRAALWKK